MADVEEFDLDEASAASDTHDAEREPGARPARRRRQSHPVPWVISALALVALGAANVGPAPIVLGHDRGLTVGLLDVAIANQPVTLWEVELRSPQVMLVDGSRAVVVANDRGVSRSVLGVDLASGAEVWRFEDEGYTCSWATPVVCVEGATTAQAAVVVIDVETGERTRQPRPGAVMAITDEAGMVVVEATETAYEDVVLTGPDGEELWRVAAETADLTSLPIWSSLRIRDGQVNIDFSGIAIDLATGELVSNAGWEMATGVWANVLPTQEIVVQTATESVTLSLAEALMQFDDNLGGPVAIVQSTWGDLGAIRRSDGVVLWTARKTSSCYPMARVQQTLLTLCWEDDGTGDRLLALDTFTGHTRWQLPAPTMVVAAAQDTFLIGNYADGRLQAFDATDGSLRWSQSYSASEFVATEIADGILLSTGNSLVRLVWD